MTNRITGLATGLDIDSLVSAELAGYKSKITKQEQNKEILQIQQEMYRDIITQGSDFYNKYLDLAKGDSMLNSSTYATTIFSSSNENAVTAQAVSGSAIKDTYKVDVIQLAAPASTVLDISQLQNVNDKKIYVSVGNSQVEIDLSSIIDSNKSDLEKNKDLVTTLNNNLSSLGLKATYSEISGGVILQSKTEGAAQSFTISSRESNGMLNNIVDAVGKDAIYTIASTTSPQGTTFTSSSNTVTHDGIKFTFTEKTNGNPITITGKTDATAIVDKICDFFDDYNTMLINFQTVLSDKHDRDYLPLTEDQKSEMTDSQITKWEAKVKQGQLHNDSLVQSLVSQMRMALSSKTAELKAIGITITKDYNNKAGTYEIDKEKLKAAIEKDPDAVMKIFTAAGEKTVDNQGNEIIREGTAGVFVSLKNVLYDNTVSTTKSALIQKAGTESFNSNSTISKQITKYARAISQMQSTLARKEQKLYSKYASLETIMNKYNTQLSHLQSYFA